MGFVLPFFPFSCKNFEAISFPSSDIFSQVISCNPAKSSDNKKENKCFHFFLSGANFSLPKEFPTSIFWGSFSSPFLFIDCKQTTLSPFGVTLTTINQPHTFFPLCPKMYAFSLFELLTTSSAWEKIVHSSSHKFSFYAFLAAMHAFVSLIPDNL